MSKIITAIISNKDGVMIDGVESRMPENSCIYLNFGRDDNGIFSVLRSRFREGLLLPNGFTATVKLKDNGNLVSLEIKPDKGEA